MPPEDFLQRRNSKKHLEGVNVKIAYKSDVGKKRKNNEDSVAVDKEKGIFALADGMGGHQAGEIASNEAVEKALAYLRETIGSSNDGKDLPQLLAESLFKANDAIKERAKVDINFMGMGTTLVQMVIRDGTAHICNVGDSRAYLLRDHLQQITRDQTVGNYLVEHGIMKREEVPLQKWHTLTQAVGTSDDIVPELKQVELKDGDFLLLCSDGLSEMLEDEEIEEMILKHEENVDKAVDALIKKANRKGGVDNITVVLVRYE